MRVLTSKYGFLVAILMMFLVAKTNSKSDSNNTCTQIEKNKSTDEGSKVVNFFQGIIKSNNYTKYFYENSANFIPIPGNPVVIENVKRSFLSVGQVFTTCGSSMLLSFNIKDEADKDMLTSNIEFNIGSENIEQYPQELDNILKGLTTSDTKVFLSNMEGYPKSFTNYRGYDTKILYKISATAVNIKNGVINKFPFYFSTKSTKKTLVPQCKQSVSVQYTLTDLVTAAIIAKKTETIQYAKLSVVPISYPLLGLGINNETEVVATKKAIMDSFESQAFEKTQVQQILKQKLASYKDSDPFVLNQVIFNTN